MTRTTMKGALLVALVPMMFVGGCWGSSTEEAPKSEAAAEAGEGSAEIDALVVIAKAIKANPDNAEQILADAGMTAEAFEAKMYEVAEEPKASQQYIKAMQANP